MATNEYIERFRYNDGEGIEFPDFNDQQTLVRRTFHGDVNGLVHGEPWTTDALPLSAPVCRPIGDALIPVLNGGTADVRVNNGGLYFAPVADPGTPAQHVLFHRLGGQTVGTPPANTFAVSTSSASGGGAGDRNDLLTAKVIEVTNVADDVARDFEDALGALTSQATNKRFRTQLELLVVEGTEGAGDPAVAADVVTIARYIMRDGASVYTAADIEDLRAPSVAPGDFGTRLGELQNGARPVIAVQASGTWTPGVSVNATPHASFSGQDGFWLQTGNQVLLSWVIVATVFGATLATDTVTITAIPTGFLPFSGSFARIASGPVNSQFGAAVPEHSALADTATNVLELRVTQGSTVGPSWPASSVITGQITLNLTL